MKDKEFEKRVIGAVKATVGYCESSDKPEFMKGVMVAIDKYTELRDWIPAKLIAITRS